MLVQVQFTLKQISCFVAAGESGSILKAAENIHVSQPSISNAIAHLESIFRLQLFIRHHAQDMSLTSAGSQRKTMVVDIFSEFCGEQISTENIPGMAKFEN